MDKASTCHVENCEFKSHHVRIVTSDSLKALGSIVPLDSLKEHKMARPMDDSVAAIVRMNITNTCPMMSSK